MATCDECCGFNLKDVESYVKKHDIHYILKDCIIKLCSSRPDNPYRFMREYFENLEKVCMFGVNFRSLFLLVPLNFSALSSPTAANSALSNLTDNSKSSRKTKH